MRAATFVHSLQFLQACTTSHLTRDWVGSFEITACECREGLLCFVVELFPWPASSQPSHWIAYNSSTLTRIFDRTASTKANIAAAHSSWLIDRIRDTHLAIIAPYRWSTGSKYDSSDLLDHFSSDRLNLRHAASTSINRSKALKHDSQLAQSPLTERQNKDKSSECSPTQAL